ncbi:hypothetical protein B0T21DRAFT_296509 [Apiosordaria backusii]|uniref:Uncharacterized protein n=1 Tax=Apiosordaria backusii TaxID=314023 RepID=A0AA40AJ82_9PEZI|nr:hypothetical protein B0T21DRAFT_296509 [Apiosordaria backusii]
MEEAEQADPYPLDAIFQVTHDLETRMAAIDRVLDKFSKMVDESRKDKAQETEVLAMQLAQPILALMRYMDREGCEVTDAMIQQSRQEVWTLSETTEMGIQDILGQLHSMEATFTDKQSLLKRHHNGNDQTLGNQDFGNYAHDITGHSRHRPPLEFGQYSPRSSTPLACSTSSTTWHWKPVDFVSFFSPKDADNHYDLSMIDTAMAGRFFNKVVHRVIKCEHPHFDLYNEVRIPCPAEGQGPLIVGQDPPSIVNWDTWQCVNAMLKNSGDQCCCPDEARYCLRYQVWCISLGPTGSTQNVMKLMWFEIDPVRTGWDVLRAMGSKDWIPVNFVTLFSCAKDVAKNHPEWCDMQAVDDFFVALMIGDSSGRRHECFRHANEYFENVELDGMVSNHYGRYASLSDWNRELDEDQDMDKWKCLNFVLALSKEEAEDYLRDVRDHGGWMMQKCCCPSHTRFCLAIWWESKSNTDGERYNVVRTKWIKRRESDYESDRMLASPVWGEVDPEVEEKLKLAFEAGVVEEHDEDETDDDVETDEDEEMGENEGKGEMSSLFIGSEDGEDTGDDQDQDRSPDSDTLDFERSAPGSPYSPRRSLPKLASRKVGGQRRSRPAEDEGEGKAKRRRVDSTTDGTENAEEQIPREWTWITEKVQFRERGKL